MRILYFSEFYKPERIASAFRASEHAKYWVDSGHELTVFTDFPHYPAGKLIGGYTLRRYTEEFLDGVRVVRNKSIIESNRSLIKRAIGGISFLWYGWINSRNKHLLNPSAYDVVLATSGTVFSAWVGMRFARRSHLPLVVEIRDLTYKQMVATGSPESSIKVRIMKLIELYLCRVADYVVPLTNSFSSELVKEGISAEKMIVVPNGADFVPCDHIGSEILRFGYFGTLGISQNVAGTLRMLSSVAGCSDLPFVYTLIGEGACREELQQLIAQDDYSFASLRSGMSPDELEPYYAQVDMTVVSLQKSESFAGTVPSKLFQSWARGVPVLFIGPEGEAAQLVRASGAGIALCGTDDEDKQALRAFMEQSNLCNVLSDMRMRAGAFMKENFARRKMAEKMLSVLERAAEVAR